MNSNIIIKKINFDGQDIFVNFNHLIVTFEAVISQDNDNKMKIVIPSNIKVLKPEQNVIVTIEVFKEGKE